MKSLLLTVAVIMGFTSASLAQNVPNYVPTNGLVGWWPFNGNANDESGNGIITNIAGPTLNTDRFGNAGNSYFFDGNNDTIYVSSQQNNVLQYSFSAWFKTTQGGVIVSGRGSNLQAGITIRIMNLALGGQVDNGRAHFGTDQPNGTVAIMSNNTYLDNQWHHIVGVFNSDPGTISPSQFSIYVDGSLVSTFNDWSVSANSPINNQTNMYFGNHRGWNGATFLGNLDDIGMWNRALTQQEITALYQGANTNASCLTLPLNLQQGLVGYWPFCGNANDESGNGNNGTVNGATLTSDRFGNAGGAFGFLNQNDFIEISTTSGNFDNNNFSISFWMKTDQTGGNPSVISRTNSSGSVYENFVLFESDGKLALNGTCPWTSGYSTTPSNTILGNVWKHVVATSTPFTASVYINGVLAKTDTTLVPYFMNFSGLPIRFGRSLHPYWGEYNGELDDVAIWNRVLSQQEITQLNNQGICQTSITVTDTLLIHTGITSYNPVAYQNTLKVWPNPGNSAITLDAGNLGSMQGWKFKVANTLGQSVVNETPISQQQTQINLSNWGGNGIYYLHLINPQGHAIEIKKIVLAP